MSNSVLQHTSLNQQTNLFKMIEKINLSVYQKIISFGIHQQITEDLKQSLTYANIVNLTLILAMSIWGLFFVFLREFERAIPMLALVLSLSIILFLTKIGLHKISRVMIATLPSVSITIASILNKKAIIEANSGVISVLEYVAAPVFIIGFVSIPLLIFNHKNELKLLIGCVLINLIQGLFYFEILNIFQIGLGNVYLNYEESYIIYIAPILATVTIGVTIFTFKIKSAQAQEEVQRKQEILLANEEELKQNLEELTITQERIAEQNDSLLAAEEEVRQNYEELQATQEHIVNQERDLQTIFDAIPVALVISNPQTGQIIKTNKTANFLISNHQDELTYKNIANYYANNEEFKTVREILKTGGVVNGQESMGVKADGTHFPILGYLQPIQFNANPAYLGTIIDISNLKEMQSQMEAQFKELQNKNDEMMAIEEELRQNMEETTTQRDFIEKAQKSTELRNKKISRFTQILMSLSKNKHVLDGDYLRAVEVVVSAVAKTLEVDLVSAWEFKAGAEEHSLNLHNILAFNSYDFSISEGNIEVLPKESALYERLKAASMLTFSIHDTDEVLQSFIQERFHGETTKEGIIFLTYDGKLPNGVLLIERKNQVVGWVEEDISFVKSAIDVLSLAKNNEREVRRKKTMEENSQWLMRLNKSRFISLGMWDKFLDEFTRACAKRLQIDGVAIWRYRLEQGVEILECEKFYNKEQNAYEALNPLTSTNYPDYFQAIAEQTLLNAKDVFTDEKTSELSPLWKTSNICSILQEPFFINGQMAGLISLSQCHQQRLWAEEEITLLKGLGSLITVAQQTTLQAQQHHQLQTQNEELEAMQEKLQENYSELQTAQKTLEEKAYELDVQHAKTLKSIQYAETIQRSILPSESQRLRTFEESFVIFKPKDIVSGDFYWISAHENGMRIAAVIDCTGHGVPGAFVSMVGHKILSDIIFQKGILDPATILELLDQELVKALQQDEGGNDDGMDISLCLLESINQHDTKVTFSGSKSTLYYTLNNRIHELKGDRRSIGGMRRKKKLDTPFSNQEFTLSKGDLLYLLSDGLQDQNNIERQKMGSVKCKQLLEQASRMNVRDQKKFISTSLKEHKGLEVQRDDITILGIRV